MRTGPAGALAAAVALVLLAGIGDRLTRDDVAFTLIYLAPVALAAWRVGLAGGLAVAALAAATSLAASQASLSPAVRFWNVATELSVFGLLAALLADLRRRLALESERALTDPLTGVANRRALLKALREELERVRRHRRPLTLALLDLDDFKRVNDTLGHAAGDEVLATVAHVLRRRLRGVDTVARVGGDEFALLLPETAAHESAALLEELLRLVPGALAPGGFAVGLSVGAVTFEAPPASVEEALGQVDELLYAVKRQGKGGLRHAAGRVAPARSHGGAGPSGAGG